MTSRNSLWKRSYMSVTGRLDRRYGWSRLPKPIALLTLMGLRMRLRRENLFDTSGVTLPWAPSPLPDGPRPLTRRLRRHGQRPDPRGHGIGRCPLRSQRPAGGDGSVEGAHTEPPTGQPGAAHPREVPTGDDPQRAGRRVAAVRGARLVQPRDQRARRPLAGRRSTRATRGRSTRCRSSARTRPPPPRTGSPPPTPTPRRTGGTPRRCTAARSSSRRRSGPTRAARSC